MDDRMRILLCEDDENLGMLLREYLPAKGFNADLYADGDAGYKAFLKGKYDICVLDVMMPKKDGFQLAQEIRSVNSEVPIISLLPKPSRRIFWKGSKSVPTTISPNLSRWRNLCSASRPFCAV